MKKIFLKLIAIGMWSAVLPLPATAQSNQLPPHGNTAGTGAETSGYSSNPVSPEKERRGHSGAASAGAGSESGTAAAGGADTVAASDRKMMVELAQANMAEIETGKIALEQTNNPEVKAFAQRMIDDHTKAAEDLTRLAKSKRVELPTEPDAKHQAMAKKLRGLSGEKFDKQYISQAGIADHRQTIALLNRIAKNAKDPELRGQAEKLLPTVKDHLDMAQKIKM